MKKEFLTMAICLMSLMVSAKGFVTHCTITTYNPSKEQCNADYLTTSNGTKIDMAKLKSGKLRYVAVSRDILGAWAIEYNDVIELEGYGQFVVVDTMHPRFNHYIDIMQHKSKPNFKAENVKVTIIKKNTKKGNK